MSFQVLDVCLFGLAVYLVRQLVWRKKAPLPPGPPGWPLIGNLLDVPAYAPHKTIGAMSRKYGPVMSLNLMSLRYVVIDSPKAAKELLEKRSAITSGRPHFTMGCDLVGWADNTIFLPYGETHRKHRKFFYQQIGTKSSLEAFYPTKEMEAKKLLCNVLKTPDDLIVHCRRAAIAVILKISHGYTVNSEGRDPLVEIAGKAMDNFAAVITPGRFLVDMLPILRYMPEWFPGCGFHKDAREWRKILNEAVDMPYDFVVEHLAMGSAAPSFISRQLQEGVSPEDEKLLKWASFSMYLGGSETTPTVLSAFFLAMTIYPEVQRKAQAEVDTVVGNQRLPTFDDRDALPYVNALCKEIFRWHVVAGFGVVHLSTQDTVYDGYLIPKGTHFVPNIWSMLNNPETYPNPDVFNPERFLGNDQQPDPREMNFGWGRRSCPGALVTESTMFICVAMALATLNVLRRIENGVECVPRYESTEGTVRVVKPFECRIERRSKQAEDLLQS